MKPDASAAEKTLSPPFIVSRCARGVIWVALINNIAKRVIKQELCDQQLLAFDHDTQMDMDGTATVPARIYGEEIHTAIGIADLPASQERDAAGVLILRIAHPCCTPGIDASGIGMPNLDVRNLYRAAVLGSDKAQADAGGQSVDAFRHVTSNGDVIGMAGTQGLREGGDALGLLTKHRIRQVSGDSGSATCSQARRRPVETVTGHRIAAAAPGEEGNARSCQKSTASENDGASSHRPGRS